MGNIGEIYRQMFPRRMPFPLHSRLLQFSRIWQWQKKKKKKTRHLHHVCYARSVNASARRQRDFAQERDQSLIRRDGWCGIPMHYIVAALFIAGVMPPAGLRYRSQIGRRVVVLTAIRPRDFSIRFTRPFSTLPPRGSRKESKRTRERARKKERGISREWRSRD